MTPGKDAKVEELADAIDRILPQTQCTRCGYPACRPYAEAIAGGKADINQCPPGGQAGIIKLAAVTGRQPRPLNPANGVEGPVRLAFIDESVCIGCTLCIQACPVDAIIGTSKQMHTVIESVCTGCELCVAPCPVDCIDMVAAPQTLARWNDARADDARRRYESRKARLAAEAANRSERPRPGGGGNDDAADARQALIRAAMERARANQAATRPKNTENLPTDVAQRLKEIDERRSRLAGTDKAKKP